jgi:hypothetical protein
MADVTIDVNDTTDIVGLNDIKADLKLELPQPFKTEGSNTLEVKPLKADFGTNSHLAIDPLKLELDIDPLKTDSSLTVDLKPAVIDLCLTASIGKIPSLCVRQPYHHHIGFTLFGMEVWGLTLAGQQETVVEELNRQPKIAWGGGVGARPPYQAAAQAEAAHRPSRHAGGLRIRIEP